MSESEDKRYFTDESVELLKDLNRFILSSASLEYPSVNEFKELLQRVMQSLPDTGSSFFGVLDRAYEEACEEGLFPADLDDIMDSLMDDLNGSEPLLRVSHNPSDQWSSIEQLDGDGYLQTIAYFASPNMAENSLDFLASQVQSS